MGASMGRCDMTPNPFDEFPVHESIANFNAPPKTNMEPKNGGLEDDFPFQTGDFQVPC